ncbi:hypothetical protein [Nonomuraea basaltis]|uniref:hypothetical protein n=1 Tax=Nonomuraea basaltis TaxID=2495887 RepID=UPI00110C5247|nr:hypothetical protein [Nonomuraea basaltis]TMR92549.1 hypothetical protein EJK15_43895 [Nonomuraea basaltis]
MTGTRGRPTPVTALAGPAAKAVPTIDRITIAIALSDGTTATIDIPQPVNAGLDYQDESGPCLRHSNLVAYYTGYCPDCDGGKSLTLAVELNPWRDDHGPAYTVTTQQAPAPERGSP